MKANEAPEKIYINGFSCFAEEPVKDSVEYLRKDVFIKRAKKWFEQQPETYDANGVRVYGKEDFEDFENYMKGE